MHEPLFIIKSERLNARVEIDLALEKTLVAEKDTPIGVRRIMVEVKSFTKASMINELHSVVGQYFNYKIGIEALDTPYELYLAVPETAYHKLSQIGLFNIAVERLAMKIVVFNNITKTIVEWKE
jgi:hypothetical protein